MGSSLPLSPNRANGSSNKRSGTQAAQLKTLPILSAKPRSSRDEFTIPDRETNSGFGWTVLKDDELPDDVGHMVQVLQAFIPKLIS